MLAELPLTKQHDMLKTHAHYLLKNCFQYAVGVRSSFVTLIYQSI